MLSIVKTQLGVQILVLGFQIDVPAVAVVFGEGGDEIIIKEALAVRFLITGTQIQGAFQRKLMVKKEIQSHFLLGMILIILCIQVGFFNGDRMV